MKRTLRLVLCVFTMCFLTFFIFINPASSDESTNNEIPLNQYGIRSTNPYVVDRFVEDGKTIEAVIVPGSPHPPEGFIRDEVAKLPVPNIAAGTNTISNVPAMTWVFGCTATSAAMMFGYYDNSGYFNMYAGPTNGGVFPMTNAVWGTVDFGNGDGPMALCPLSATRMGLDGRMSRGHVDDYWIQYGNAGPDPYIGHWTEHTPGECTGDYIGTNQSKFHNSDGWTTFYYWLDGSPRYDYIAPAGYRDSCHGLKLFVESRGYTVQANGNFSQLIYGYNGNTQGFTYANFKAEIDAGRPVLIWLEGHTMLGYGYNDPSTIYVHDTWDYSNHSMTWGGTYSGMQHYAVTVLRLQQCQCTSVIHNFSALQTFTACVGQTDQKTITFENTGNCPRQISGISFNNPVFSGDCSGTVLPGESLDCTIYFTPKVVQTYSDTAYMHTDCNNPALVLSGIGKDCNNPVPVISSINPSTRTAGGAAFTLTVNGSNFLSSSKVQWQGTDRVTTFVSATQLTAAILAADISTPGTAAVSVVNPAPGGGTSNTITFTVSKKNGGMIYQIIIWIINGIVYLIRILIPGV